jgi:hypothetical protein
LWNTANAGISMLWSRDINRGADTEWYVLKRHNDKPVYYTTILYNTVYYRTVCYRTVRYQMEQRYKTVFGWKIWYIT